MKNKFAAQLFTLRDQLKDDFPGILRDLKEMGWAGVQMGGLFGYSKEEIAAVLQETDLKTAGLHAGIDRLRDDLQTVVEEAETFQTKDIICPFVPDELRNAESYRAIRRDLNEADGKLKKDGYRIKKGGHDPLSFIKKYAHRLPIIHLKDMANDEQQSFAEVGTGLIHFEPILKWGEQNGIDWYAVEQDECPGDPMESLQISLNNLNKMADNLTTDLTSKRK
jgi:sugar phosphate isomerase/epimerase